MEQGRTGASLGGAFGQVAAELKASRVWAPPVVFVAIVAPMSLVSYLLFHSVVELSSVVVAFLLFAVAWQTYGFSRNDFTMSLGCGYFWIGLIDLAHTFTYKGMGVLPVTSANPATQLWIGGRYLESAVLLAVVLCMGRAVNRWLTFAVFGAAALAIVGAIWGGLFPVAFVEGEGLTAFKVASEYLIIAVLAVTLAILLRKREHIDRNAFASIVVAILFTMAAELSFTLYVDVYGLFNLIGHVFKVFSYWMIFLAIVRTMLVAPYKQLEEMSSSLAEAQREYRNLYDQDPVAYCTVRARDAAILRSNSTMSKLFGYSAEEFTKMNIFNLYADTPEDKAKAHRVFDDFVNGIPSNDVELLMRRKDASPIWVSLTVKPVMDETGQVVESRSVLIDIEQRMAVEAALKTSNKALRTIRSANRTLVHATSEQELLDEVCRNVVVDGGFHFAWIGFAENDASKRVHPVARYGHNAGYLDEIRITWADAPEGRGPTGIAIRTGSANVENDITSSDSFVPWREGALRRGYRSSIALPLSHEGACFGALNIYASQAQAFDAATVDILQELAGDLAYGIGALRAKEELRDSEERLRSMIAAARDAVIMINREGKITYWNDAATQMLGYEYDEALGHSLHGLIVREEDRAAQERGFEEFIRSGQGPVVGNIVEVTGRRKNGEEFPAEVSVSAFQTAGQWNAVGIVRDITERKQAEAIKLQTQRMDTLGSLAGGVAHDINNMLLPIIDLLPMVMKNIPEDSRDHTRLDMSLKAAGRMKDMAARILAFTREEGTSTKEIDLCKTLGNALEILRSTLPTTIEIVENLNPATGTVLADPKQIEALLMNLASNAADALEGKTGTLTIKLDRCEVGAALARKVSNLKPRNYARLTVSDTGCGMDEETVKHIFDPLFTTKGKGRGTGLGLAMVYGTVTKSNGAIDVSSTPGVGTTFDIYLPIASPGGRNKTL